MTGNVTGNVTGDVTGNVTGNVTGVSTGADAVKLAMQVTEHPDKSSLLVGVTQNTMPLRLTRITRCLYVPSTNTFTVANIVGDLTGDVTEPTTSNAFANTSTIVLVLQPPISSTSLMVEQEHKLKSDTSLRYTPTSQTLTTGTVVALTGDVTGNVSGNLTGNVTGDVTGNADTATTASSSTNIQIDSGATDANRLIYIR